jgi:hypothetical protein
MLSREEDVRAQALRQQGWSISAIARHLQVDRKTVRAYLSGEREPGKWRRSQPTLIEPFLEYCRLRLADDPHLWASTLFDELVELGFAGSYPALTTAIRTHQLCPHCEPCQVTRGRDVAFIAHPPGEETQWDWVKLGGAAGPTTRLGRREARSPAGRGLGALRQVARRFGRGRGFPHLVEALDAAAGRGHAGLAVRPDGHGLLTLLRADHRPIRAGRQALVNAS